MLIREVCSRSSGKSLGTIYTKKKKRFSRGSSSVRMCVGRIHLYPTHVVRKENKRGGKLADGFQFVDNFLLLYASVLEPYRDLSLGQVSLGRYSPPFVFRDKFVGSVLAFEFLQLHLGVWNALFPSASVRAGISSGVRSRIWEEDRQARPHELPCTRCAQTLHLH